VTAAVQEAVERHGKIDVLVNNAGLSIDNLLLRLKEEEWDRVIDVNLKGAFLCTKAVVRSMLKQKGGRIINLTSVVAQTGNAGQAAYTAAKAGVMASSTGKARVAPMPRRTVRRGIDFLKITIASPPHLKWCAVHDAKND